ncbi:MAG: protoheme IX farnesyltransferase, partial [Sphingomonadaceae bacterium]|nr:protoheme IX farnesyltransferase [Sphingomonadaceae bacterium]
MASAAPVAAAGTGGSRAPAVAAPPGVSFARSVAAPPGVSFADWRDYVALLKPRVMSLVVFSAACALFTAPGHVHPFTGFVAILCVAVGAGAAGALNMWYEADIDAVMKRTAGRPLPSGRIAPHEALAFGVALAVGSVVVMGLGVGWLAAAILAASILFYAVVYTAWLKRRTPQNIVIGGAAGAFPPLIGWAAVTGDVTALPWLMFAIIFLWTPPHFWSLALFMEADYAKAGVPMLPVVAGEAATRRQILAYTLVLIPVTLLPWALGLTGWLYGAVAVATGAVFVARAAAVWRNTATVAAAMGPEKALFR